jgi:hypothetical protein
MCTTELSDYIRLNVCGKASPENVGTVEVEQFSVIYLYKVLQSESGTPSTGKTTVALKTKLPMRLWE